MSDDSDFEEYPFKLKGGILPDKVCYIDGTVEDLSVLLYNVDTLIESW